VASTGCAARRRPQITVSWRCSALPGMNTDSFVCFWSCSTDRDGLDRCAWPGWDHELDNRKGALAHWHRIRTIGVVAIVGVVELVGVVGVVEISEIVANVAIVEIIVVVGSVVVVGAGSVPRLSVGGDAVRRARSCAGRAWRSVGPDASREYADTCARSRGGSGRRRSERHRDRARARCTRRRGRRGAAARLPEPARARPSHAQ